jgi:starch phosphorylase
VFSSDDPNRFKPLVDGLRSQDRYMLTDDFDSYYAAQRSADEKYLKPNVWTKSAILNIANMAWFSSDRTIAEYAQSIWGVSVSK